MGKKVSLKTCLLLCIISILFTATVFGTTTMKQIVAYINYGVSIVVDGEKQEMYDANSNRVYPISYNGTTYIPLRGMGEMLGYEVDWNNATNSVIIKTKGINPINLLQGVNYKTDFSYILEENQLSLKVSDSETKQFTNGLYLISLLNQDFNFKDYLKINIPNNVNKVKFHAFSEASSSINIFNQQGKLLKTFYLKPNALTLCELNLDTSKQSEIYLVGICQDESTINKNIKVYDIYGY